MKFPNCLKAPQKKMTAQDVLRAELKKAHDLHPAWAMPGAVITALTDAGFTIISNDELDTEIALAFQAGVDSVAEA
jgi:hypothetical protein